MTWTLSADMERLAIAGLVVLLALAAYFVMRLWVLRALHGLAAKTGGTWDDTLMGHGVFSPLAWLAPVLVLYRGLDYFPDYADLGQRILGTVVFASAVLFVSRLIDAALAIYDTSPVSARRPLKGYAQLVKLFVYLVGAIVAVCLLLNKSPWGILSGLGAMTAVLLLVFRDTILSFTASVQIIANDIVRKGDWIEMPSAGADGDVVDIALHMVKVRNFDKTIVTIPTSRLISDSFKNWRGMAESGGRRIKRPVFIDQSSVRFLSEAQVQRFESLKYLAGYVSTRSEEIRSYNAAHGFDRDISPVNGRGMTNLGTFRAYVWTYLERHPHVRQDMTLLVRQLSPRADSGLPLEIYCFTDTTDWNAYEDIQADIFDHVLASLPEFGLRAYQRNALADSRVEKA